MFTQSVHQFAEKVALITGGSSPIGRAVALQLALNGAYVIVADLEDSGSDDSIQQLEDLGTLAFAVRCDFRTAAGAAELASSVEAKFGRLDFLVNCLKFRPESAFLQMSEELLDEVYRSNTAALLFVVQAVHGLMAGRPRARIVNVLSGMDTPETGGNAAFAASQKSVEGITESLAGSLGGNFRTNAVAVSEVMSSDPDADPELFPPRPRVASDDAARAVLYLLSSESTSVNGQVLRLK